MLVALIQTGSVNLTQWLPHIPCRGNYAQSKQRRLSRWLHNPRLNPHRLYAPLIRGALSEWQDPVMYLSLDTSLFWNQYCLVRLAVVYRGRTLPLVWRVLKHPSASVAYRDYREMFAQAVSRLPSGVKVVVLADRGFSHTEVLRGLTQEWGWHYRIRLKSDSWIWQPGRGWRQLKTFHFKPGQATCLHSVRLRRQQFYGPVHLIVGRNNVNGKFWAVVSDEPTTLQTFAEYGLRFQIEESFLDDQSHGWNLQASRIKSAAALSRLGFLMAVATLYLSATGTAVVAKGRRRWVDPHWQRGHSYFRIGWDWIRACEVQGWRLIRRVRFLSHRDRDPAMASRRQHQARSYALEFQLLSYPPTAPA